MGAMDICTPPSDWKPGDPIGYIRTKIPDFAVPPYAGPRYEATVPDTLDLQERMALAVNVLTRATDPLADYEIYFWMRILQNPAVMRHDYSDQCVMKFMEALPLMRIGSGSLLHPEVDRRWMEVALHQIGPDGLAYVPVKGRPWALNGTFDTYGPRGTETTIEQQMIPTYCGRLLRALMVYHLRDGGSLWKDTAQRMVDGLSDLAVDRGRYAYFSPMPTWAVKGSTEDKGERQRSLGGHCGFIVAGLSRVYRETGYEPARRLADKLVRYVLEAAPYFDGDGRFLPDSPYEDSRLNQRAHFHCHTLNLQAFLEHALSTGDKPLMELVLKGYQYGRAHGEVLLGYFPECLHTVEEEQSETCEVADMVALALGLSEAGLGDHWDDADRWGRNMLVEAQLTHGDWIDRLHMSWTGKQDEADRPETAIGCNESADRVAERNLGCFAGYPTPNDWWSGVGMGTMHCCTGNGTRALYYLWEHILRHEGGKLRVNLLLNRASPWADVDSHIPYVGQVDVKVKQPVDLSVRIPEWVKPPEVRVQVNRSDRRVGWAGRYATVGGVKPGDVATLTFPIAERTDFVHVEKKRYLLVRKGNDVVAIEPAGRYCPLYQREHYRANSTRWRTIERFVSAQQIHW